MSIFCYHHASRHAQISWQYIILLHHANPEGHRECEREPLMCMFSQMHTFFLFASRCCQRTKTTIFHFHIYFFKNSAAKKRSVPCRTYCAQFKLPLKLFSTFFVHLRCSSITRSRGRDLVRWGMRLTPYFKWMIFVVDSYFFPYLHKSSRFL